MADFNRLRLALLLPFALVALTACEAGSEAAGHDAAAQSAPAAQAGQATPMQTTAPMEGAEPSGAVQMRRTGDGGVEIRKMDAADGQGAGAAPAEPHQP
ncbi:hypothetical protein U5F73_15530 [Stenotrophomonas pavanii]|uniref:hypothetical protein n=1 Tax=Stenotrophomonas pavanii TaxID=487698 RepID=UPI00289C8D4D|nr:hypothetical protein [Stenotrophomonas pavanii]MDZ7476383.1 hypothetical protein [Stenotrophomonas pavanii]